jgi:hypothetical protein
MAVIAVDEPLERSFDGLIDKADIEGAPGVKLDIVEQFPYWSGLRAWTSQKYWVPTAKTPAAGV